MTGFKIKTELMIGDEKAVRTMVVPTDITLKELNNALIIVFDWENIHAHRFELLEKKRIELDEENRLSDYRGKKLVYTYDIFNKWEHRISFLKDDAEFEGDHPVLLKCEGERPLENIGGLKGHQRVTYVLNHSEHPDYESVKKIYDAEKPLNDIVRLNRRLKGDDEDVYISDDSLEAVAEYFRSEGETDIYYDPASGEVVESEDNEPLEGCILILKGGETALYSIANEFMEDEPKVARKFKDKEVTSLNYDEFEKCLTSMKLMDKWDAFLTEGTFIKALEWAGNNSLRNSLGDMMEEYLKDFELTDEDIEKEKDAEVPEAPMLKCRYCGNEEQGVVRMDLMPDRIKGKDVPPVEMVCGKCHRSTITRMKNDGFLIDVHCSDEDLPFHMYEPIHEFERQLDSTDDELEKFDIRIRILEHLMMMCSNRRDNVAYILRGYTDVLDEERKMKTDLVYFSVFEPTPEEVETKKRVLERFKDSEDVFVRTLYLIARLFEDKSEETIDLVEEHLGNLEPVMKGYVLKETIWGMSPDDPSYGRVLEMSKKTLDELYGLCQSEKRWSAYPRMFADLQNIVVDSLVNEGRIDDARTFVSPYDRLSDTSFNTWYPALAFIIMLKKAALELSAGNRKEGVHLLEELDRLYDEGIDYGPYSNRALAVGNAILLNYKSIKLDKILFSLDLVIDMVQDKQMKMSWLEQYVTLLTPSLLKRLGEKKTLEILSGIGLQITDRRELKKVKYNTDIVWMSDLMNVM